MGQIVVNQDDLRLIYARYLGDVATLSTAEKAALEAIALALDQWFVATQLPNTGRIGANMAVAYAAAKLADEWQLAEWERP
jgi:hypothetical protein